MKIPEHNRRPGLETLCQGLQAQHPDWSKERCLNEAKVLACSMPATRYDGMAHSAAYWIITAPVRKGS